MRRGEVPTHLPATAQKRCADDTELLDKVAATITAPRLLERVHVVRCTTLADQLAAVQVRRGKGGWGEVWGGGGGTFLCRGAGGRS